jgi:hypothetical protein
MSSTAILCVGSLEYHEQEGLNGDSHVWVRLRLICEADGKTLWHDSFNSIKDVKQALNDNDIEFYDVVKAPTSDGDTNIYIARAKSQSISTFSTWNPDSCSDDSLYVRTFITIFNKHSTESTKDIFNKDSCWDSTIIDTKSINDWFEKIKEIKSN